MDGWHEADSRKRTKPARRAAEPRRYSGRLAPSLTGISLGRWTEACVSCTKVEV